MSLISLNYILFLLKHSLYNFIVSNNISNYNSEANFKNDKKRMKRCLKIKKIVILFRYQLSKRGQKIN